MFKKAKKKKNKGKQPIERSSFTDLPIERSSFTTDLPMGRVSTANLVEQSVEDSRETKALKDNIWREEFKTRDLNREKLQRLLWRRFGDGNFTMKVWCPCH